MTAEERITVALGRMPYLPMVSGYSTNAEPERLAHTLEGLAEYLSVVAAECEAAKMAANQYESDVGAMRRLLGVES